MAAACRRRGLPEPTRQSLLCRPSGRYYLDAHWEAYGVSLEVDGVHHALVTEQYRDAVKQNELSIDGGCVLRAPSIAVRSDDDVIYRQVERALRRRGWKNN